MIKITLYLYSLPPQNSKTTVLSWKTHQIQLLSQNTWPVLLKIVKVIKYKENIRNSQSRGADGGIILKMMWQPGWDLGPEKRHTLKAMEIWIKHELKLMIMNQC